MKLTYTANSIAWLSGTLSWTAKEFSTALEKGDAEALVGALIFNNRESMGRGKDAWTRVGVAEITVTIEKKDKIVSNMVKSLRSQQAAVRAEAEATATNLERQIQQLLAITMDREAA